MAGRTHHNKRVIGNALGELDANGGNLSQTSRQLSVPISTLWGWRESYTSDPVVEKYRNLKNEQLAERFRVMSALAIERLLTELKDVSVDKLATVAAIGADKHLLLTGQPTEITGTANSKSAQEMFAIEYRKNNHCTEAEAQSAAEAAFAFTKIDDHTEAAAS
jgi:hypothetical protein